MKLAVGLLQATTASMIQTKSQVGLCTPSGFRSRLAFGECLPASPHDPSFRIPAFS